MAEAKDKNKITLIANPIQNLKQAPIRKEHPETPIGFYTQKLTDFLKLSAQQTLHMYVQKAGSHFIPSPDQTVGDLFKLFATEQPDGTMALQLAYCTQVFQG